VFLSKLLDGVLVSKLFEMRYGHTVVTQDLQIRSLQYDSRKVQPGDAFVAIRGTAADGHLFIDNAVANGAIAVVVEDDAVRSDYFFLHAAVVKIVVPDSRRALARMSANMYGDPSRSLRLVGVTGTNGKTTTTHLIRAILEAEEGPAGLLGTIDYVVGAERFPATHTTPESLELNGLLARMRDAGCRSAVMEVSSHALHQKRVEGIRFAAGLFTNLTQDHLDYHGTMEEYLRSKQILFRALGPEAMALTNADDPQGQAIVEGTSARVRTYGTTPGAEIRARDIELSVRGTRCAIDWEGRTIGLESALIGRFNVSNLVAAFAAGVSLGYDGEGVRDAIAGVRSVRGRFEQMTSPSGWTAIIDYAHTPDALEKCLRAVHDILPVHERGRIITLFGCGGNRDRAKRPIMGRIAAQLSDEVIITSDNPRKEDPERIIEEILSGVARPASVSTEVDRRKAIVRALEKARRHDVVLIAGKGHETYQVIGETKEHLDDREEVEQFIGRHG
jgi:UDP-N-acetylmuramoyl-L-alanyl-D-glutamate--2,6-diaminopimelate ligase